MSNEEYLLNRLKELESENASLKNQVNNLKGSVTGWDNLRYLINDELKVLDLKRSRPYGDFEGKLTYSIGQIIRLTFNLKFIKNLNAEYYEKAKEITDVIIKFVIDNFVRDESYVARKARGEINE